MRWDARRRAWVGWQIDVYVNQGPGKKPKRHRPTFPSETDAKSAENRLRVKSENIRLGIEKPEAGIKYITVKDVLEKHLETITEKKRKQFAKRIFEYFLELLPVGIYINELTPPDLSLYEKNRALDLTARKTPVKPESIDREITEISAALHGAPARFKELQNWVCPPFPRPVITDTRRERTFSPGEVERIITYLARARETGEAAKKYNERILTAQEIEFALLTSSRRKEVVRVKWTDYFPEQDLLLITRWKTMKTKDASVTAFSPVPRRVHEILAARKKLTAGLYIFSGNGEVSYYRYIRDLKETCGHLGIPYGRHTEGGLIFHDARHTFVSNLLKNKVDLETARELAGLSRETILRYAHSSPEQKRAAVEILDGARRRSTLKEIFEKVKGGEMDYDQFFAELTGQNLSR